MRIERNHTLGQQETMRRIDNFVDTLFQRPLPGGLTIEAPSKTWSGNVMAFSFKAKKGWVGTTIAGNLCVTEQLVVLESDLPGIVTAFVPEADIIARIHQELDGLLRG
jgi:hypothetical protein